MAYALLFDKRVEKELQALPKDVQRRILNSLAKLQEDPFAAPIKKLSGEDSYRVRVGDYRAVFDIDTANQRVVVLKVPHRKDIYRH